MTDNEMSEACTTRHVESWLSLEPQRLNGFTLTSDPLNIITNLKFLFPEIAVDVYISNVHINIGFSLSTPIKLCERVVVCRLSVVLSVIMT